jgi:hypothetical protein
MEKSYDFKWFYKILEYTENTQQEIISQLKNQKDFINKENKDILFNQWKNGNTKEKILAIELLIQCFPDHCSIEIFLYGQYSHKNIIQRLAVKLAKSLPKKNIGDNLSVLLESQKSFCPNGTQRLGVQLINSLLKEHLRGQLLTLLESQKSDDQNIRILGAELLLRCFPNQCSLRICFENQRSHNKNIRMLGIQFSKNIPQNILGNQLAFLLNTQKSNNTNIRKLGADLTRSLPKNILKHQLIFLLDAQKSHNIELLKLSSELLILYFSSDCCLNIYLEVQRSNNKNAQALGLKLAHCLPKEILKHNLKILFKAQDSNNKNIYKLSNQLLKKLNLSQVDEYFQENFPINSNHS